MSLNFIKFCGCRNFSKSNIFKSAEKATPKEPAPVSSTSSYSGSFSDFIPNKFEKRILVWSGKFKAENIPPKISFATLDNAKSKLRIKIANYMMIGTIFMCGYYVLLGKRDQKKGKSLIQMEKERQKLYGIGNNK